MRVSFWPKKGRITKRRKSQPKQAVSLVKERIVAQQVDTDTWPSKVCAPLQCSHTHDTEWKIALESEVPSPVKPQSAVKKLLSFPFKKLCARGGAEVHDSTGLDQAIAYYVSNNLQQARLWQPADPYAHASQAWVGAAY